MWTACSVIATFALGLALYVAWAVDAARSGVPIPLLIVLAPLLYLALVAIVVLACFAVSWIWRSPRPASVRIGPAATLRMMLDEIATVAGSPWRMAIWWWGIRDPAPGSCPLPVLLLHGVLCNAGVWRRVMSELERRGVHGVYALSYGPPLASIDAFADQVAELVDTILRDTGAQRLIVVSHSMGGLVARAYLRRYGSGRIARLVTIGSPHRGSLLARAFVGRSVGQMRPGNGWLDALDGSETRDVAVTSIWSWHDSMVIPQTSARLPGARDVALAGIAHNALLRAPVVLDLIVEEIAAARSAHAPPARVTSEFPA